jgi:UDP-2-acetamido-3-amino-2,3-dideoxy-glucuronate N-acetyltransferase
MIHPLSDVQTQSIGEGTFIWQFSIVLRNAIIGNNCNINAHCFIENDVIIGNNVTIKCGNYIWDGIRIADNVQIGPNVTLTNDKYPRAKNSKFVPAKTIIGHGASIGGGATLVPGVEIGEFAMIGAGALVTKNVPSHALVVGSPAKIIAYVDEYGNKLPENIRSYNNNLGKKIHINAY